nr:hypothetical protein [Saprospiraceae bacterium]
MIGGSLPVTYMTGATPINHGERNTYGSPRGTAQSNEGLSCLTGATS